MRFILARAVLHIQSTGKFEDEREGDSNRAVDRRLLMQVARSLE